MDRGEPLIELPVRRCAVLGSPIEHSLSPVLHRAAYRQLGLPWRYDAVRVEEADLEAFVSGLGPQWRGLSVTMPLKERAAALAVVRSRLVTMVGAANTLLREPDGWHAENTDVPGVHAALLEQGAASVPAAVVLGGGSTAAAAVAALAGLAAEVVVAVRTPSRAKGLRRVAESVGVPLRTLAWADAARHLDAPVVVSTTPAGATDALASAVPAAPGVLLDVVYHPWPTALAAAWSAAGGRVAGGLDLLAHQAGEQVRLMTGRTVDVDVLRRAGLAARGRG